MRERAAGVRSLVEYNNGAWLSQVVRVGICGFNHGALSVFSVCNMYDYSASSVFCYNHASIP